MFVILFVKVRSYLIFRPVRIRYTRLFSKSVFLLKLTPWFFYPRWKSNKPNISYFKFEHIISEYFLNAVSNYCVCSYLICFEFHTWLLRLTQSTCHVKNNTLIPRLFECYILLLNENTLLLRKHFHDKHATRHCLGHGRPSSLKLRRLIVILHFSEFLHALFLTFGLNR